MQAQSCQFSQALKTHSDVYLACKGVRFLNEQVIDGLDWLSMNYKAPAVAVLALGGDAQFALDQAAHNLVLAGVPVVVAAGNDGTDACNKSPAR